MKQYYVCITPFFPSAESFRGSYVLDQVKAIERNSDFKVIVLMPTLFYNKDEDYEYDGIKVYRFIDYNMPSNIWPNALTDALSVRSMLNKLAKIGININDIAVAHGHVTRFGVWANALKHRNTQIKSIVQHHGFDVMSVTDGRLAEFEFHKRHCIKYGVKICNEADLNIGVSKKTLEFVKSIFGIRIKDDYVLYNGVDINKFNPGNNVNKQSGVFTVGCVANFWKLKDQMTLIKAVERLVNAEIKGMKVIFIGTGYTREQCEEYVNSHNLTSFFEFRKEVNHNKLPDFYRNLDLFVLPSYWEAFGCVYTEAYACGVPFIGVKGQGISEIVANECQDRWLIDKGDDARLAMLIKQCMDDPECRTVLNISIDIDVLIKRFLRAID